MKHLFSGQVVLVAGASGGLGRAVALLFAHQGAKVAVVDTQRKPAATVVREIRALGMTAIAFIANTSDGPAIKDAIEQIVLKFGRLDYAFNNIDINESKIRGLSPDALLALLSTTLTSINRLMSWQISEMSLHGRGSVVNSIMVRGFSQNSSHTKSYSDLILGVVEATDLAARTCIGGGIRVNAVMPSAQISRTTAELQAFGEQAQIYHGPFAPTDALVKAEGMMAETIVWLCSAKANSINGQVLVTDGGFSVQ